MYRKNQRGHDFSCVQKPKYRIFLFSMLLAAALLSALLTGCRQSKDTLESLLADTNAAHQKINNDGLKQKFSPRSPVNENGQRITFTEQHAYFGYPDSYDPDLLLSPEQMKEDVTYLFDSLYACYGNYDRMGGRTAFDKAEQAILEECAEKAPLKAEEFQQLLLSHLEFVKDSHFTINGVDTNPSQIAFFFRETEFCKTEDGYAAKDGKAVASIDGYDDLNVLFHRSISPEGEIVYYPVLLKDCLSTDAYASTQICTDKLTVHYDDGSTQVLQCEPYTLSDLLNTAESDAIPEVNEGDTLPVCRIYSFMQTDEPEWQEKAQKGAELLKNSKVGILDMRFNSGGYDDAAMDWLKEYAGASVPTNALHFEGFFNSQQTDSRDLWIENENVLIILTSKRTASSGEWLVDAAHNLENVLVIGENTSGSMLGSAIYVPLKNSNLKIGMGMSQSFIPSENDYFEEYRGLCPDLWVPAGEAEELANKLIERLT